MHRKVKRNICTANKYHRFVCIHPSPRTFQSLKRLFILIQESEDPSIKRVFHNARGESHQKKTKKKFVFGFILTPHGSLHIICNLYGSSGATGSSVLNLDLDIGDSSTCAREICNLGLGVLGVVIGDSGLDSILSKHGAVQLNGWET